MPYRAMKESLNAVIDSLSDGILVTDKQGKIILYNQKAEAFLGIQGNTGLVVGLGVDSGLLRGLVLRWGARLAEETLAPSRVRVSRAHVFSPAVWEATLWRGSGNRWPPAGIPGRVPER
jgi:hypothetical protein